MSEYASRKANEAWSAATKGNQVAIINGEQLAGIAAVIASVIEDCAREAERQIADDDGDPASDFSRGYKEGCLSARDAINHLPRSLSSAGQVVGQGAIKSATPPPPVTPTVTLCKCIDWHGQTHDRLCRGCWRPLHPRTP